jgi:predicted deacylase
VIDGSATKVSRRLIDITGLRDIVQRRIPVLALDSKVSGPVVWLTACIHGDEVGGTVIVHEVFKTLRKLRLNCGTVHALPLINSMGFENVSRYIKTDREDLNRCFPGNVRGSMGKQIARRLFDAILKSQPDLVIDLHNDWVHSVPYILIEPTADYASQETRKNTLAIARATRLLLVEDSDTFHPLHNTLTGAIVEAGIAAFTIEAGGTYGIVEKSVAAGKDAILSTLRHLGMIDAPGLADQSTEDQDLLTYTSQPRCTSNGLIRFAVAPGDTVRTNQILARVYSAFGSCEEKLRATGPGYVLGLGNHARVLPGCEVIAIAEFPV